MTIIGNVIKSINTKKGFNPNSQAHNPKRLSFYSHSKIIEPLRINLKKKQTKKEQGEPTFI